MKLHLSEGLKSRESVFPSLISSTDTLLYHRQHFVSKTLLTLSVSTSLASRHSCEVLSCCRLGAPLLTLSRRTNINRTTQRTAEFSVQQLQASVKVSLSNCHNFFTSSSRTGTPLSFVRWRIGMAAWPFGQTSRGLEALERKT